LIARHLHPHTTQRGGPGYVYDLQKQAALSSRAWVLAATHAPLKRAQKAAKCNSPSHVSESFNLRSLRPARRREGSRHATTQRGQEPSGRLVRPVARYSKRAEGGTHRPCTDCSNPGMPLQHSRDLFTQVPRETVWKLLRMGQTPHHETCHRRVDECLPRGA
jgi:hypothetical protein